MPSPLHTAVKDYRKLAPNQTKTNTFPTTTNTTVHTTSTETNTGTGTNSTQTNTSTQTTTTPPTTTKTATTKTNTTQTGTGTGTGTATTTQTGTATGTNNTGTATGTATGTSSTTATGTTSGTNTSTQSTGTTQTNTFIETRTYVPNPETQGTSYFHPTDGVIHKHPNLAELCLWLDAAFNPIQGFRNELQPLDQIKVDSITFDSGAGSCTVIVQYIVGEDRDISVQLQESGVDAGVKTLLASKGNGTLTFFFVDGSDSVVEVDDVDKVTAFITRVADASTYPNRLAVESVLGSVDYTNAVSLSASTHAEEWNDAGASPSSLRQRIIKRENFAYAGMGNNTDFYVNGVGDDDQYNVESYAPKVVENTQFKKRGVKFEENDRMFLSKPIADYYGEMEIIGAIKWHNGTNRVFRCGDIRIEMGQAHLEFFFPTAKSGETSKVFGNKNNPLFPWRVSGNAVIISIQVKQNYIKGWVNGEVAFEVELDTPFGLEQRKEIPILGSASNTGHHSHLEWCAFDDSLSEENRHFVEAYLSCKWKITLDHAHPLFEKCPTIDPPHGDCLTWYTVPDVFKFTRDSTTTFTSYIMNTVGWSRTATITGAALAAGMANTSIGPVVIVGTRQTAFTESRTATSTQFVIYDRGGVGSAGIRTETITEEYTTAENINTGTATTEFSGQYMNTIATTYSTTIMMNCQIPTYVLSAQLGPCPVTYYAE